MVSDGEDDMGIIDSHGIDSHHGMVQSHLPSWPFGIRTMKRTVEPPPSVSVTKTAGCWLTNMLGPYIILYYPLIIFCI